MKYFICSIAFMWCINLLLLKFSSIEEEEAPQHKEEEDDDSFSLYVDKEGELMDAAI